MYYIAAAGAAWMAGVFACDGRVGLSVPRRKRSKTKPTHAHKGKLVERWGTKCSPLRDVKVLHHCWHDVNVSFPRGWLKTVDAPTRDGRVCCYCGEIRPEPLPSMRPKRAHGPHVDDDSEWYVLDEAECPGLGTVVVRDEPLVNYPC